MVLNRPHIIQGFYFIILIIGWNSLNAQNIDTQPYRFKSITVNDNLSHSNVNAIVQDSLGYIWIGTNNGLNRFDGYEITTYKYDLQDKYSPPGNRVKAMVVDQTGQIWISFENKGLYRFDPTKLIFQKIPLPYPNHNIIRMLVDSYGDVWINKHSLGLCRLILNKDGSLKKIQTYPPEILLGKEGKIEIRGIRSSKGNLYFYTSANDVWTFDQQSNSFYPIFSGNELDLANDEFIRSFYKDGESFLDWNRFQAFIS